VILMRVRQKDGVDGNALKPIKPRQRGAPLLFRMRTAIHNHPNLTPLEEVTVRPNLVYPR
jgi:hypothetical protein